MKKIKNNFICFGAVHHDYVFELKKLSVDSLSNIYPHPAYVFIHYSHPPLIKRLQALK